MLNEHKYSHLIFIIPFNIIIHLFSDHCMGSCVWNPVLMIFKQFYLTHTTSGQSGTESNGNGYVTTHSTEL